MSFELVSVELGVGSSEMVEMEYVIARNEAIFYKQQIPPFGRNDE